MSEIQTPQQLDKKDRLLPPRPGEERKGPDIKGVPVVVYINGKPIEMSKVEALGVLAQISQVLLYLDSQEEVIINGR
jgi:hypothetical protein